MTVAEASEQLGVSIRRVQAMIASGKIRAEKHGRDWWIPSLAGVVVYRKPGAPKQNPKVG
ncbi:MAG: helix-turn-helix domain-containing protein [Bryobacteraceae bacterium]